MRFEKVSKAIAEAKRFIEAAERVNPAQGILSYIRGAKTANNRRRLNAHRWI